MSEKVMGKWHQVDVEGMLDERVSDREAKITVIAFEVKMLCARQEVIERQVEVLMEDLARLCI
jgi:hypothetical protein